MGALSVNTEKVAYWYMRLNGFLQIEDFYIHPSRKGSAQTDADLLGVRFPHRAERLIDDPNDVMVDDLENLNLSDHYVDVVIAEVKAGACALNGPWTNQERQNVQRVLAAIGCLPHEQINDAANAIYERGCFEQNDLLRIRMIAIGREENPEVGERYPEVKQVIWTDVLCFIFDRFSRYSNQKSQTDNWDETGKALKTMATKADREGYVKWGIKAMGIRTAN